MNFSITDLENKNKTELIAIALHIVNKKYPKLDIDIKTYRVTAFKSSEEVFITFERWVRCVPKNHLNGKQIYKVTIELVTKKCLPLDTNSISYFYQPSKSDTKAIAFVKKHFGPFNPFFFHTIYESETQFILERVNMYSFGRYSINKETKQTMVEIETSFALQVKPTLSIPDPLVEIIA
ncbi:hypothetical protein [Flavobacterium sp. J27]|uniref:hypothetical protein n=1 Tax=Flavobacterium sp. J27 TaxID=2060419 RepID=UPI00102F5BCB|nr:hypothetical protein [Flavobacterium sp. J27]